jgi:hypothetical protein
MYTLIHERRARPIVRQLVVEGHYLPGERI